MPTAGSGYDRNVLPLILFTLAYTLASDSAPPPGPPRKERRPIRVFHGSTESDLVELDAFEPSYKGGLGYGIYVAEEVQTARGYASGPEASVYVLDLWLAPDEILEIDPETVDSVEGMEGHSILVGEHIEPFTLQIGEDRFVVGWDGIKDSIAASRFREWIRDNHRRLSETFGLSSELIGWDTVLSGLVDRHDSLPSFEDDYDKEELVDRIFSSLDSGIEEGQDEEAGIKRLEAIGEEAFRYLREITRGIRAQIDAIKFELALDDIGNEAKSAGYRAVRMRDMRADSSLNEEILVLYPEDLRMLGRIPREELPRHG